MRAFNSLQAAKRVSFFLINARSAARTPSTIALSTSPTRSGDVRRALQDSQCKKFNWLYFRNSHGFIHDMGGDIHRAILGHYSRSDLKLPYVDVQWQFRP